MQPVAKILTGFDKNHPHFQGRTRYMNIGGGLGDVFNHLYGAPCYADLETLVPGERAFVLCSSHNSHTWELLAWHRNAEMITVADTGLLNLLYSENPDDRRKRKEMEIPKDCDHRWPIPGPVIFYPPPEDVELVEKVKSGGKYVVFAISASDHSKSINKNVAEAAAATCLREGFRVVVTGRNYAFNDAGIKSVRREEIELESKDGVVDLIDELTVPGTAQLIQGADAVFTCHSALCHLSWHNRRPTYVLYDQFAKETYFTNKFEGYSFGAAFPENGHSSFKDYRHEMFEAFLSKTKGAS